MKRKDYEKPTTEFVKLVEQQMLASSITGKWNKPIDYENGGDPFDF